MCPYQFNPYFGESPGWPYDSEAVSRALSSINQSALDFGFEALTSVDDVLIQDVSLARDAAQLGRVLLAPRV